MLTHEVEAFKTALCMTASLTTAFAASRVETKDRALQQVQFVLYTCTVQSSLLRHMARAGTEPARLVRMCTNFVLIT